MENREYLVVVLINQNSYSQVIIKAPTKKEVYNTVMKIASDTNTKDIVILNIIKL